MALDRRARWRTLRGRAALSFAVLAFALATVMAVSVWATVSGFLVLQRERSAGTAAAANAAELLRDLTQDGTDPSEALAQLPRESGATSLAVVDDAWFTTSLEVGRTQVPAALRDAVLSDGVPSRQRITVGGRTMLAIGIPLPDGGAYFAVLPLEELDRTLTVLGVVLGLAVALVPPVAVALGWWVTQAALRPLARLSEAAARVAGGDTTTRIDPRGDPELVPIAASFNATAAALERRVRADARFATDVAHELRSPLTTMLAAVSLVQDGRERLPDHGREALDLLASEVERFSRLVQDLLEMSRAEAGDADLTLDEVRLAEFVERALPERLRPRLVVRGAQDVRVRVDKRRLERVLANLVDNAERHGGGLAAVTVTGFDGVAHVWVDDAGPGIGEADRERIFERFTRAPRTGRDSTSGVGLGLALVVGHLQLLGGQVWAEPSPQGGARFVVTLPAQEQS
ncbi:HAMP domain-containing sensor histidine kinase [uncultured Cellulomonas sp.]|uniref:sensor histidine kinase n=1 Tax=uncultured Cellulomonas sp. TaxID=189682 RepID=UPI002639A9F1|nr:HAMP domain-containing sensor histidine kinase [uncultured Cellulomonas sp.]